MSVEVTVHDSLDAVAAADWERLAGARSVFQALAWYRRAPAIGALRLFVAREGGRVRALLPAYVLREPGHYYHTPRELFCGFRERALLAGQPAAAALLERAAAARWFPALVSVSPYGYRGGLIADPDCPAAGAAILRGATALCRREGIAVAAYHYLNRDDDRGWLEALAADGARIVLTGADCNLDVGWSSLEEYFRSLGEHRGRRVRAEHRAALRRTDVVWRRHVLAPGGPPPEPQLARRAGRLFALGAARHADDHPAPAFNEALVGSWPGTRFLLAGERADGCLRSALLVLAADGTLYPKLFGAAERGGDYFFLTFSRLVQYAIGERFTRIEFGGGSHQAKLLRGARLRRLFAALYVFDRALDAALNDFAPLYEAAKSAYFADLTARYQTDR